MRQKNELAEITKEIRTDDNQAN